MYASFQSKSFIFNVVKLGDGMMNNGCKPICSWWTSWFVLSSFEGLVVWCIQSYGCFGGGYGSCWIPIVLLCIEGLGLF
ncbi:hypothetical protein L195_g047343 [Trifolium pratense]|uniref:Uncharacterized protein n=1 Tax=Trifolium pratense TaxID=57577 RepID=A0A2K3MK43_TRIPR|nr:hypothetical protein L195_g047343 [Trifolium pratense]